MVRDHCPTELRNVLIEIYQILSLLLIDHIIEMNVLIAPLEVMNNSPISQFLLDYEKLLEELDYVLFNVNMIILGNHCFGVLEILL